MTFGWFYQTIAEFDFVGLWKLLSALLAGAFGVLGLLTKYKDDSTGRITRWGAISLAGILVSTGLGVVAQVKEADNNKLAREAAASQMSDLTTETQFIARRSQDLFKQSQEIAGHTKQAIQDLARVLQPLEAPSFAASIYVQCRTPEYREFCAAAKVFRRTKKHSDYLAAWKKWPSSEDRSKPHLPVMQVVIQASLDGKPVDGWDWAPWTLTYDILPTPKHESKPRNGMSLDMDEANDDNLVNVDVDVLGPTENDNWSGLSSLYDMEGVTLYFTITAKVPGSTPIGTTTPTLLPLFITLTFKNGNQILIFPEDLKEAPAARLWTDKSFSTKIRLPPHMRRKK